MHLFELTTQWSLTGVADLRARALRTPAGLGLTRSSPAVSLVHIIVVPGGGNQKLSDSCRSRQSGAGAPLPPSAQGASGKSAQ